MKKIYTTLALGVFVLGANAQQKVAKKLTENHPVTFSGVHANASKAAATTTLMPSTFDAGACGTNTSNVVFYAITEHTATPTYTLDADGYLFGTNITYYTEASTSLTVTNTRAAQKYAVVGTATISGVIVVSAKHSSTAGTTMISARIYSENATTKAPGAAVGTAATKALNTFTGTDMLSFATPVVVPAGNFFASIESPAVGGPTKDTLAIYSTVQGCSSPDSLAWVYSQAAGLGGFWGSVADGVSTNNLDILIFPVADIGPSTVGINSISKGDLTLLAAFPNPASSEVNINFGLNQDSKVEITMYDVAGNQVSTVTTEELPAGNHSKAMNVSGLSAGVYMYSVKSQNAQLFSKLTVIK